MATSKLTTMWQVQSPLRRGNFKAHYDVASLLNDVASLLSPLLHGNIFAKSYKAQMLIWHLFYKAQTLIFGTHFTKPKSILAIILQGPK